MLAFVLLALKSDRMKVTISQAKIPSETPHSEQQMTSIVETKVTKLSEFSCPHC